MRARLSYLRFKIVNGFWFLPGTLVVAAMALAVASAALDRSLGREWSAELNWIFWVDIASARSVLAVVAGSMITATSLVFSMTLVALTLASGQLGPRLMAIFKADRFTQLVLGAFIATLVYALILLRLTHPDGADGDPFVPVISVTVVQVLALICLSILIFFIHHLADMLQADTIVAHVGSALDTTILSIFPPLSGAESETDTYEKPAAFEKFSVVVTGDETGYVQTLASEGLVRIAAGCDIVIDLHVKPGDFVLAGSSTARAWPLERATDGVKAAIAKSAVIGPKRTHAQDLRFSMDALVEIALRALSPGVNDPLTAVACINRIGASLAIAMKRSEPPAQLRDDSGQVRVLVSPIRFLDLLDAGLHDIRRAGSNNVAVISTLIDVLSKLALQAVKPHHHSAIERHREILARAIADDIRHPADREILEDRLSMLDAALRKSATA